MIFNFSYIQIIPAAVIVLLLAGLLTAIFVKPDEFQKSRANVFVSITASLVVLVMGFSVFVNTLVFEEQKEINNATFTKKAIDSLWLYPNKLLADSTHARPEFRASFYYNNVTLYQSAKGLKSNQSTTSILEEQNIAIVFIQAWEDYLALRRLDKTGDEVWLNNFLQWAQSPYLKQSFNLLKYNYAGTTVKFGNLLFEYASLLPVPTKDPVLYHNIVKKMINDDRLLKIFKETCIQKSNSYLR